MTQAGWGQWQNPLLYLPAARGEDVTQDSAVPWQQPAGRAVSLAVEQVEPHARPLVRDAQRGEGAAPLLDGALEGEVRVELLRDLSSEDGAAAALTTSEPDKGGAPRVCA